MDHTIAGLRACLFFASFFCAYRFTPMAFEAAWCVCRRITPSLAAQLAAGIWITALGSMAFSGHRLVEAIAFERSPVSAARGWDAFWLLAGLLLMTVGYFLHGAAQATAVGKRSFVYYSGAAIILAGMVFAILASAMA